MLHATHTTYFSLLVSKPCPAESTFMATNLPVLHGDGKRIRYNTVHFTFAVITLYYILLHVINPNPINEFRWISQCCASVVWMSAGPEAFPLVHGRCAAPALPRCPARLNAFHSNRIAQMITKCAAMTLGNQELRSCSDNSSCNTLRYLAMHLRLKDRAYTALNPGHGEQIR